MEAVVIALVGVVGFILGGFGIYSVGRFLSAFCEFLDSLQEWIKSTEKRLSDLEQSNNQEGDK